MSFLDSQQDAAEEGGPPSPSGPATSGGPPAGPPGGGPVLAQLRQQQGGQMPVSAPGPGDQASSMTMLQEAMARMNRALPGLMGHPAYQDVLRALQRINRHLPQGSPTLGVQRTNLQDLLQGLVKSAMLSKIAGQQRPQPGASPDQPAGPAPAPMPSTPMPGS